MVENNPGNRGDNNRRSRGPERGSRTREPSIKAEAYKFLPDQQVQDTYSEALKNLGSLFSGTKSTENIKKINSLSAELMNLQSEMRMRGLMEDESEEELSEEDEFFEDMAENQAEGIKEKRGQEQLSGNELGEFDLKAQNALRSKLGKRELGSFDEIWKEAQKDNRKFDVEKSKAFNKMWGEAQKDNKIFDEEKANKEAERKAEKLAEGDKKLDETLKIHQEGADAEGRKGQNVEKTFDTYEEMLASAQAENKEITKIRSTSEYKVEQSLKPIYKEIDQLTGEYSDRLKTYEKSSWLNKLKPSERHEAAKNRERVADLENLKYDLTTEEVNYTEKRKELTDQMDILSSESAGRLSKMYEGGQANGRARVEYENILNQIAILEENHQNEKDRILSELQDLGAELPAEPEKAEIDFSQVNSDYYSADEELFKKDEEKKMRQDSRLRGKLDDIENQMKKQAEVRKQPGTTLFDFFKGTSDLEASRRDASEHQENLNERDKQIQREVEKYKKRVLETRLKIRRLTKMIEEEKKKGPEKMNFNLIHEAGSRVQVESLRLTVYGENLREKVLTINKKSGLKSLMSRIGFNVG